MKSWIALLKREYLEHRGAFLWLPLGLLALFTLAGLSALVSNSTNITVNGTNLVVNGTLANPVAVLKLFEGGIFRQCSAVVGLSTRRAFLLFRRCLPRRPAQQFHALLEVVAGFRS